MCLYIHIAVFSRVELLNYIFIIAQVILHVLNRRCVIYLGSKNLYMFCETSWTTEYLYANFISLQIKLENIGGKCIYCELRICQFG